VQDSLEGDGWVLKDVKREGDGAESCQSRGEIAVSNRKEITVHRILQFIRRQFPSAIEDWEVWGYGRLLWDVAKREDGRRPAHVLVLGQPGVGSTTLSRRLSQSLNIPSFTLGEMIKEAVESETRSHWKAGRSVDRRR